MSEPLVAVLSSTAVAPVPTASSSSFHPHHPKYAVDGKLRGTLMQHSWLKGMETSPWWTVDLGQTANIALVRVTARWNCCGNWMDGFNIMVGCKVSASGLMVPQGMTGDFVCSPSSIPGRRVTIVLPGTHRVLAFQEVEVFSDAIHKDKSCYQSGYPEGKDKKMGA